MNRYPESFPPEEFRSSIRLAVGVFVENETPRLEQSLQNTIRSAQSLSENVFILEREPSTIAETVANSFDRAPRLISRELRDDNAAVRNELIEFLERESDVDWILWFHAGERFDETTRTPFLRFLDEERDPDSLYMMVLRRTMRPDGRRHDFDEETIDARLMPLRKGIRFEGPVRETPIPTASRLMIPINAAPGRFLCPAKYADPEGRKIVAAKNWERLERLRQQGETPEDEQLAFRADTLIDLGEYETARNDCRTLIEKTDKTNLRLEAYCKIWETMMFSPLPQAETTKILLDGLDRFPVDMQLLVFMAGHLQRQGRLDLAARTYETAIRHGRVSLDVWHRLHVLEIAVTGLALVRRQRGELDEAIRVLETNREYIDDRSEYDRHLFDLYIARSDESKALETAATVWGGEELDRMREVLTAACRASQGSWEDALSYLIPAYENGCRDVLCLRWYALALLALRRFDDAIPVLEAWVAANPEGPEARAFLVAARNPERFTDILRQMQGLTENPDSNGKTPRPFSGRFSSGNGAIRTVRGANPRIDQAVREMIRASAKPEPEIDKPDAGASAAEESVLDPNRS